jgi:hypothetical protein
MNKSLNKNSPIEAGDNKVKETAINRAMREMLKVKNFLELLDTAKKQNVKFIGMVHDMNNQQQDLLHELELKKFYNTEGARKAKLLQQLRRERRAIKDTLDLWRPLKDFANKHPELKQELCEVLNEVSTVVEEQNSRYYCPRTKQGNNVAYQHYAPTMMDFDKALRQ